MNNYNFIFQNLIVSNKETSSSHICNEFSVQQGVFPVVHRRYGSEAPQQHQNKHQNEEELYDVGRRGSWCALVLCVLCGVLRLSLLAL